MRSLLSRLAFWWAAPAAALSLLLPTPLGSWVAAAAVLAAGVSLSLRALRGTRRDAVLPDPADEVDEVVLIEAAARVVRCTSRAADLPEALHGVARVLVQELGAEGLLTGQLDSPQQARRAVAGSTNGAQRQTAAAPPMSALARQAVAGRAVVCDRAVGMAVPVLCRGQSVAWIEFQSIEIQVGRAALVKVLDLASKELSAVAERQGLGQVPAAAELAVSRRAAANDPEHASKPFEATMGAASGSEAPHPLLTRYLQCRAERGVSGEEGAAADGFDPMAVERLRVLDPQGVNRLLERVARAFDTSCGRLLPQLLRAAQEGHMAAVRQLAHTLQSSASSVGAIKLSMQCAEIEAMSRSEPHPDLLPCIEALEPEAQVVMSVLRGLVGPRA
jgi:HPt (histidine-containing phosphotransfer) domain-containing protein